LPDAVLTISATIDVETKANEARVLSISPASPPFSVLTIINTTARSDATTKSVISSGVINFKSPFSFIVAKIFLDTKRFKLSY
jgi:hypothetical protein